MSSCILLWYRTCCIDLLSNIGVNGSVINNASAFHARGPRFEPRKLYSSFSREKNFSALESSSIGLCTCSPQSKAFLWNAAGENWKTIYLFTIYLFICCNVCCRMEMESLLMVCQFLTACGFTIRRGPPHPVADIIYVTHPSLPRTYSARLSMLLPIHPQEKYLQSFLNDWNRRCRIFDLTS